MFTSRRRLQRLALPFRRHGGQLIARARRLLVEPLEDRRLLAVLTWTGQGSDLDWANPANWNLEVVPGPNDDVVIDVPGDPLIFSSPRLISVRSLNSREPLNFSGVNLRVGGASLQNPLPSVLEQGLAINGGQIEVIGRQVSLTIGQTASFSNVSLRATGGATLYAPALSSVLTTTGAQSIHADEGSTIELPELTSVRTQGGFTTLSMASSSFDATPGLRLGTDLAESETTELSGSGTTLNLNDGTLICKTLQLTSSAILQGSGIIEGNVINESRLDVDIGSRPLKIVGDFNQSNTGVLDLQLRFGVSSELEVTQAATIAGSIHVEASATPPGAGSVDLIVASSLNAATATVQLPQDTATRRYAVAVLSDALEIVVTRIVTWDGGAQNLEWGNRFNWSEDALPGLQDTVLISALAASGPITNQTAGLNKISVRSLSSAQPLALTGVDLEVAEPSEISAALSMAGGSIVVDSPQATFSVTAASQLVGTDLRATGGGHLAFTGPLTYATADGGGSIISKDSGSQIDLSGLTNLAGADNSSSPFLVQASEGGEIVLAGALSGAVDVVVDGAASHVDLSQVAALDTGSLDVRNGAQLSLPAVIQDLHDISLFASAGGQIALPYVTSYSATAAHRIEATGAESLIDLSALTLLDGGGVLEVCAANGGGIVLAGKATGHAYLEVEDPISTLDLTRVNSIDGATLAAKSASSLVIPATLTYINDTSLIATDGSQIDAPGIDSLTGAWDIDVDGLGSRINLPALRSLYSGGERNQVQIANSGLLSFAEQSPVVLDKIDFVLSGGTLEAARLVLPVRASLSGTGAIHADVANMGLISPEGLLEISGRFEQVSDGAIELVVAVTPEGVRSDQLRVAGEAIFDGHLRVVNQIPPGSEPYDLVQFESASGDFSDIELTDGTAPDFVTRSPTAFRLETLADHQVRWDGGAGTLHWFDPENWTGDELPGELDDVFIPELPSGAVVVYANSAGNGSAGKIRSLHGLGALSLAAGELIVTAESQLSGPISIAGGRLTADGPAAAIATGGAVQFTSGALEARNSGHIALPGLTSLGPSFAGEIIASGQGSKIDLLSVDGISTAPGSVPSLVINVLAGAQVDLSRVSAFGEGVAITVDGAGSSLNLRSLGAWYDDGELTVRGGRVVLHPTYAVVFGAHIVLQELEGNTAILETGALALESAASLTGSGTITGDVFNSGEISPGGGLGKSLHVIGDYEQRPTGKLLVSVLRDGNTLIDRLIVSGTAQLGGSFSLGGQLNFIPLEDERFSFIEADQFVYEFAAVNVPQLPGGLHFAAVQTPTQFSLQAVSTPSISIDDVIITRELNLPTTAVFTVRLSHIPIEHISVHYSTANSTAQTPSDYVAVEGILTFAPGEAQFKTISVAVASQNAAAPGEQFFLLLNSPDGASIADDTGVATLSQITVAQPPALNIDDVSVARQANEAGSAVFTVRLSRAPSQPVTVHYATRSGAATAPNDFAVTQGTIVFEPDDALSQTISVPVTAQMASAPNEQFFIDLNSADGATIADGSAVADLSAVTVVEPPSIRIDDVNVLRQLGQPSNAVFTIRLSHSPNQQVTVHYATRSDSATQPADYAASAGELTFEAGDVQSKSITISVAPQTSASPNERFFLNLSSPQGATIEDDSAVAQLSAIEVVQPPPPPPPLGEIPTILPQSSGKRVSLLKALDAPTPDRMFIVLNDVDLNEDEIENIANYRLLRVAGSQHIAVAIEEIDYSSIADRLILRASEPLALGDYLLEILSDSDVDLPALATGVHSRQGVSLDGDHDGAPGGTFAQTFEASNSTSLLNSDALNSVFGQFDRTLTSDLQQVNEITRRLTSEAFARELLTKIRSVYIGGALGDQARQLVIQSLADAFRSRRQDLFGDSGLMPKDFLVLWARRARFVLSDVVDGVMARTIGMSADHQIVNTVDGWTLIQDGELTVALVPIDAAGALQTSGFSFRPDGVSLAPDLRFDLELAALEAGGGVGLLAFDPAGNLMSRRIFAPTTEAQHVEVNLSSEISGIDPNLRSSNDQMLASMNDILGDLQRLNMPVLVFWLDPSDLEIIDAQGRSVSTKNGLINSIDGQGVWAGANGTTELAIFTNPGGMFSLQLVGLGQPLRGVATYINGADVRSTALQGFLAQGETISVFLDFVDIPRGLAETATLTIPTAVAAASPEPVAARPITLAMSRSADSQVTSSRIVDGRISWVAILLKQLLKKLQELLPDITIDQATELLLLRAILAKSRLVPGAHDIDPTIFSGVDIQSLLAYALKQSSTMVPSQSAKERSVPDSGEETDLAIVTPPTGSEEAALDQAIAETHGWIDPAVRDQPVRLQRTDEQPAVTP